MPQRAILPLSLCKITQNTQKAAGSVPSVLGGFYPQPLPAGTGGISSARGWEPHLCDSPEKGTLPGDQLRKLPHKSCSPSVREAYSGTERKVRLNVSHSGAKLDRHSNLQTALSHPEHLNFTLGTRVGEV